MQGWVKLHRKIEQNDYLQTNNSAYLLFTKLLYLVDRKKGSYRTGRYALAERVNLKPANVYKTLIGLETHGLVSLQSTNKYTLITITNWAKYQDEKDLPHHDAVRSGNTLGSRSLTDKKQTTSSTSGNIKVTSESHQSSSRVALEQESRRKNEEKELNTYKSFLRKDEVDEIEEALRKKERGTRFRKPTIPPGPLQGPITGIDLSHLGF